MPPNVRQAIHSHPILHPIAPVGAHQTFGDRTNRPLNHRHASLYPTQSASCATAWSLRCTHTHNDLLVFPHDTRATYRAHRFDERVLVWYSSIDIREATLRGHHVWYYAPSRLGWLVDHGVFLDRIFRHPLGRYSSFPA